MRLYGKRIVMILMICLTTFLIAGCSNGLKDDKFHDGTDYQFMFFDSSIYQSNIQKGEDGYFFINDGFLFKIDAKTKKVHPVCNKEDCKHDWCEDVDDARECKAYIKDYEKIDGQIQYYNGWIYYRTITYDKKSQDYVSVWYGIKADGSGEVKEVIQEKGENIRWLIHRGELYYLKNKIKTERSKYAYVRMVMGIYRVAVENNGDLEKKVVYETPKGFRSSGSNYMGRDFVAYGGYLYFSDSSVSTNKSYNCLEYEEQYYCYQMDSNKVKRIDRLEGKNVYNTLIVGDHLLFLATLENDSNKHVAYRSDFSCEEIKKMNPKLDLSNSMLLSDGKYLYDDNYHEAVVYDEDSKKKTIPHRVVVYDENFNKVDSYYPAKDEITMIIPGDEKNMFEFRGSEIDNELYFMDKAQIGSLNDKSIKRKRIFEYIGNRGGKSV